MNKYQEAFTEKKEGIADTLILGIGNLLLGDEGVGVHVVQELMQEKIPESIHLLDGGTAGIQLMEAMEQHRHVILIDATMDGRPAGTIRKIRPRFSSDFPAAMSTHDLGLKDLVSGLALLGRQPEITLFVVSIKDIQPMYIGLSEPVRNAMPSLKEEVVQSALEGPAF